MSFLQKLRAIRAPSLEKFWSPELGLKMERVEPGGEKLGRAVDRQPGLPPGELFEQNSIGRDSIFSRLVHFYDLLIDEREKESRQHLRSQSEVETSIRMHAGIYV